ncbi:hypothetical protein [Lactobacillus johnsonii]|uniref:hypothetical protein n=1 Tax=Lactobacillus johnsonii TaxID=33959 RepID=UPI0022E86DD2|nr:hypothetical protein [Lactobacillus johnsonii]
MKDLLNVYEWNYPEDILNSLDISTFKDKYGIKYVLSHGKSTLLFYVHYYGRYVLTNENEKVKYLGNGEWEIKYGN